MLHFHAARHVLERNAQQRIQAAAGGAGGCLGGAHGVARGIVLGSFQRRRAVLRRCGGLVSALTTHSRMHARGGPHLVASVQHGAALQQEASAVHAALLRRQVQRCLAGLRAANATHM